MTIAKNGFVMSGSVADSVPVASRSSVAFSVELVATGASLTGASEIETVATLESSEPSETLYVNESLPFALALGMYVTAPAALRVSVPFVGFVTAENVIGSASGSDADAAIDASSWMSSVNYVGVLLSAGVPGGRVAPPRVVFEVGTEFRVRNDDATFAGTPPNWGSVGEPGSCSTLVDPTFAFTAAETTVVAKPTLTFTGPLHPVLVTL